MSFLAPLYLALAAAVGVPLLLHLLRRHIATRVDFPAARYLLRAEAEHSRSLRPAQPPAHAAARAPRARTRPRRARPFLPGLGVGHGPTAVAVVLDNSISTTAVVGGSAVFDRLRDATRRLIAASTPEDRLWLITSDGRVRGGSRDALIAELARIAPSEGAGDLALALARAASAVQGARFPSQSVAVATDAQRTSWTAASRIAPPRALVPSGLRRRTAPCSPPSPSPRVDAARLAHARVETRDSVGYRIMIGERTLSRGATGRGEPIVLRASPRSAAGRPVASSSSPTISPRRRRTSRSGSAAARRVCRRLGGSFAATAVSTLIADGRAAPGARSRRVRGRRVAAAGAPHAARRSGAARRRQSRARALGIPWRFGALDAAPSSPRRALDERLGHGALPARASRRRSGDTLATAGGEPWIVAGRDTC
jgi:hypothetical protein